MEQSDWTKLPFFKPSDNWGDWTKMDVRVVKELCELRKFLNKEIVVTAGTQGDHCARSFHFEGLAIDAVISNPGGMSLMDFFFAASRFKFYGIGLYRDWLYEDKPTLGFHLDQRQFSQNYVGIYRANWLCVGSGQNRIYLALNEENLKQYGII